MKPIKTFNREKHSYNLARLKKAGHVFEVLIDPDKIIGFKTNKLGVSDVLLIEKIFSDAKKGIEPPADIIKEAFNTTDVMKVASVILEAGEIQFTQEYRELKRKEKLNKIIDIIARNSLDPRTGLPHPRTRIESAMHEAKIRIDDLKSAEDQIKDIVHKLKPILPIKIGVKQIQVKILPKYAGKAYPAVKNLGKILNESWQNDGSWLALVEIPAGMQNEFFDAINKITQGTVESRIIKE